MLFTLKRSLSELTRHLVSHPSDEAALSAVCVALQGGGQITELVAVLELCSGEQQGDSLPDHAMAELCFRIAKGSADAHARELCRTALDLCPVHMAALELFEKLADASWTDELCARYQIFLEDAPSLGVSPDICEAVTSKLLEAGKYEDLGNEHLCNSPKRGFSRGVSEVDSLAEWQFTEVLSIQA